MARPPITQVDDDQWTTISWKGQHEACCDCGLEHKTDYRVHNGKLQFKARRLPKRRPPK